MDMKLIMYISKAKALPSVTGVPAGLLPIVRECRVKNPKNGISGALYYRHGRYVQIIEGKVDKINQLMSNILKDFRHENCVIQLDIKIKRRVFTRWQSQFNTSIARDTCLRRFIAQYSDELKAMSPNAKSAFNHVIKNKISKRNNDITEASVNVFGDEKISLKGLPKLSLESNGTPLIMKLCGSLVKKPCSVDELLVEHGDKNRDEILALLRDLNHQGLLHFGELDD